MHMSSVLGSRAEERDDHERGEDGRVRRLRTRAEALRSAAPRAQRHAARVAGISAMCNVQMSAMMSCC